MTDYATLLRDHVTLNIRSIAARLRSDLLISTSDFRSFMKIE